MLPLLSAILIAQTSVAGTVTSTDGAPIDDAVVTVQTTTITTRTTAGAFSIPLTVTSSRTIVAAKKGYFNGSTVATDLSGALVIQLERLPADNPLYEPKAAAFCVRCHGDQVREWQGSTMARAGLNRWVHDIFNGTGTTNGMGGFVYIRDSPHAASSPASECGACHEPETWMREPHAPLGDLRQPTDEMLHGVSCEVCHKIGHIDETKPNYPGIYPGVVDMVRPQEGLQVQFGVRADSDFVRDGRMRPAYQPQLTAAVCAACHQDKNDPDGDGDFEEANGVISEPTYLEWLASPYADPMSPHAATCVDCHMRTSGRDRICDILFPPLLRPPEQIRSHVFEGTTPAYLDNALTAALRTSADGGALEVQVTLTNDRTGHHVPTGVTIRNVLLIVEAWQAGLPLVPTSTQTLHPLAGVGDPTDGHYAGLPGKLYGKVNHGPDGTGPVFFTDATGIQFDSRIPALASDTTRYRFDVPSGGPVVVRARVIYRRAWRELVDAKQWTQDGFGNPLEDVAPPHFGHLMTSVSATIAFDRPALDGGVIDSGLADAGPTHLDASVRPDARPVADAGDSMDDESCDCSTSGDSTRAPWGGVLILAFVLTATTRRYPKS